MNRQVLEVIERSPLSNQWSTCALLLSQQYFQGVKPDPQQLLRLLQELNVRLPTVKTLLRETRAPTAELVEQTV